MLSADRDYRPTAADIRVELAMLAQRLFPSLDVHCKTCHQNFPSRSQLDKHFKDRSNRCRYVHDKQKLSNRSDIPTNGVPELKIRGAADAPAQLYYDETTAGAEEPELKPSPCVVCMRHFNSKRRFYGHLHGAHHYRNVGYVLKRHAENALDVEGGKAEKRARKWTTKGTMMHE